MTATPAPLTTLYAGGLGLLYLMLSSRVAILRMTLGQSLGDGGHKMLRRAIRTHGNMAEYVPFTLLLMLLLELGGGPASWLHGVGAAMTLGRIAHAVGLAMKTSANHVRRLGATLSIGSLGVAAAMVLFRGLTGS